VPGSFGVTQPSAPADELSAVAAALALLRSRLGAVVWALTVAADCKHAVEVPHLRARATDNHAFARIAWAEFEARARSGQVHLAHVRGHSGDPCNELVDSFADLGCCGEASHNTLLSWLGDLRLPELALAAQPALLDAGARGP
jgi:ribonuclease HI